MTSAIKIDTGFIQTALQGMKMPVTLSYYTSDVESWYSHAERQLLEAVATASEHVTLQVHADRWSAEREEAVNIARTPAIALSGEHDTGIRYYGMPDGYELEPFLGTLSALSSGKRSLHAETIKRVSQLDAPLHLEVIVLPT